MILAGLSVAVVAGPVAASATRTYTLAAALSAKGEVPKPIVKPPARAGGSFTATYDATTKTLRWTLRVHDLTGQAVLRAGLRERG